MEPQTNVEYAAFQFNGHLLMLHKICVTTCVMFMVTKNDWEIDVQSMKDQCIGGVLELIKITCKVFPYP